MKRNRFWIEIVALGTSIACAVALLIATLGAAAVAVAGREAAQTAESASAPKTYLGMVTCSRCGAKHSAALGRTAADCVRTCVRGGAGFALVDGDKTYMLEGDSVLLKDAAGRRASVVGVVRGNTIKVSSVTLTT
jgi:hypothetical protein